MEAPQKAKSFLDDAKAVGPDFCENNALYFFAAGVIEPDLDRTIQHIKKSVEMAPDFQIAQYLLAAYMEKRFRKQNEITPEKVKGVIAEYKKVLNINPGNIASIAAQGYLYWLTGDRLKAEEAFKKGYEIKATSQETFVGELSYGLARIAVEESELHDCLSYLDDAFSAEPGIAAYSSTAGKVTSLFPFYEFMRPMILERYIDFKKDFESRISTSKTVDNGMVKIKYSESKQVIVSRKTIDKILSFVLNDCGNACANYYLQFGDEKQLNHAINNYEKALKYDKSNSMAYYNLSNVLRWKGRIKDKLRAYIYFEEVATKMHISLQLSSLLIDYSRELKYEYFREIEKRKVDLSTPLKNEIKNMDDFSRAEMKTEKTLYQQKRTASVYDTSRINEDFLQRKVVQKQMDKFVETVKMIFEETQLALLFTDPEKIKLIDFKKINPVKLNENDLYALILLAEVSSLTSSNFSEIIRLCKYIKEEYYPEHFNIHMIILDACRMSAKQDKGIKSYFDESAKIIKDTICKWIDDDPFNYANLTWVKREYGFNMENIINYFKKAFKKDPDNPAKYSLLGNAYSANKEFKKSIGCYKKALSLDSAVAVYQEYLGAAYRALKKWDKAIKTYEKALEIEPNNDSYRNSIESIIKDKVFYVTGI